MTRALLFALALSLPAAASERRIGQIVATTTKNNSDTAVPFTIRTTGRVGTIKVVVQCDTAAYVSSSGCADSACAATATDTKVSADYIYDVDLVGTESHVAILAVSGTATCQVRIKTP